MKDNVVERLLDIPNMVFDEVSLSTDEMLIVEFVSTFHFLAKNMSF